MRTAAPNAQPNDYRENWRRFRLLRKLSPFILAGWIPVIAVYIRIAKATGDFNFSNPARFFVRGGGYRWGIAAQCVHGGLPEPADLVQILSKEPAWKNDMWDMETQRRREPRLRSRGRVSIYCEGGRAFSATIYDIAAEGLGLLASQTLPAGARVRIEIHGLAADGIVRHCQAVGNSYHIGIALERIPSAPAAT